MPQHTSGSREWLCYKSLKRQGDIYNKIKKC